MPITRVPIVHRFGIISHGKRLELQERLARKVIDESTSGTLPRTAEGDRNIQYGINEEFVQQYNETEAESEEKLELHEQAKKIFLRAKRKAGLRDGGIGNHVALHQAWIDLSLLAQCNSRSLQDGALSALYNSLYHAPIRRAQIVSLLKLASTSIHWLAERAIGQPYLRSGELGLLKVAHLVFLRLYYHHLAGDIQGYPTEMIELFDIVQAFSDQQENYRPFPSSLLLVRIICRISNMLKTSFDSELRQLAEMELMNNFKGNRKSFEADRNSPTAAQPADEDNNSFEENDRRELKEVQFRSTESDKSIFHDVMKERSQVRLVPTVPSIHDSSPTLWHSLDLWRILTHTKQDLKHGLKELVTCSLDFISEPMLDSILALHTISEVAKMSYETLNVLQFIARQEILGLEENSTINPRKQRTTKKSVVKSSSRQRDIFNNTINFVANSQLEDEHTIIPTGRMPAMERHGHRDSLDSVPSFLTDLDDFLDPKPIGSNTFSLEEDHLFEAEQKTDNFKQEVDSPATANKESSLELNTSNVEEQAGINVSVTERINGGIIQSQDQFDAVDQSKQGINNRDPGSKQPTLNSIETQAYVIQDTNVLLESEDGESRSVSGGSLADVSSLGSNQPRDVVKTRSSKRRVRKRAKSIEIPASSTDESEDELKERFEKYGDNRLEFPKRESSVSLVFPQTHLENKPGSTLTITRPNTNEEMATTTKWPWELIVTYARCMGDICIHGNTSQIQRDALIGCKDNKAGLMQLLKFQLKTEKENTDWSWRVRHVTVQELTRVCHWGDDEPIKDGLRNTAWGALLSHHSVETDRRVIEAYKIARTEVSLDLNKEILDDQKPNSMPSIYSRICTNLAIIHLTVPCDNEALGKDQNTSPRKNKKTQQVQRSRMGQGSMEQQRRSKESPKDQMGRVSIRNEIMIATALEERTQTYGNRSWQTVQEVVEDQWRKEIMEEYEIVEQQKQDDINKQVKNIERSITTKSLQNRV